MPREREAYLVFNPGPPRRKKKSGKRRNPPTPAYNADLVSIIEFTAKNVGSVRLNDTDRALIKNCMRRINDLIIEIKA
jgi:hypothetical protein